MKVPCALLLLAIAPVFAEPLTMVRIDALSPPEQASWRVYLERSQVAAGADEAALNAELAENGMNRPLKAPEGGDFKLAARASDAWYASEEARLLTDVVLSYQTPSGGWSKHTGYLQGPRKPGMQWTSQNEPGQPRHYLGTFDNRSTVEQLYLLAYVWQATGREDCKAAFVKGLAYILAAQYPNGGWPQVYPLEGGYHDNVTFNDDAMTRVLGLLRTIESGAPAFTFLTDAERTKAADALAAGIQCVLRTQFQQHGNKTVWCAQYDPLTLEPSSARAMEPAALSGAESVRILQFLMSIAGPTREVIHAIESGLAWFEGARITGMRKTTEAGITTLKPDNTSAEVYWARFHDLKTGRPVFPGRDGVLYETFEAMAANNRVGYDYYSTLPQSLLSNGQKKWRKMLVR